MLLIVINLNSSTKMPIFNSSNNISNLKRNFDRKE